MTKITQLAQNLRKNQTSSEKFLWLVLRGRKLGGKKFLRQHPLIYGGLNNDRKFFIADFYCSEHKLVIELDGGIHEYQKKYDENRDLIINGLGLTVLRFKNEELKEIEKVTNKIKEYLV